MEKYKVTVVVPAYNAEKTIERTLNSILQGEYRNIEVLVVNDGSTDRTAEIVKSFMEQDNRVKLISQVNCGCGAAKCRGIKESSGDYIAFCDADDWLDSNFLQEHIKHLEKALRAYLWVKSVAEMPVKPLHCQFSGSAIGLFGKGTLIFEQTSMIISIILSTSRKPNALRMINLILLLVDSILALLIFNRIVLRMCSSCRRIL